MTAARCASERQRTLRLLFVCTGNICRSPLAAAVLRCRLDQVGLADRVRCASAGLRAVHAGKASDPRALAAGARRGYDLSDHRARAIEPADFHRFDLVLGMGAWHVEQLRPLAAAGSAQLASLLDYAPDVVGLDEVPDPHPGDAGDFERALDLIERGCAGLLHALEGRLEEGAACPSR